MIAGVAAGHPATAGAGVEILREGGSAADAAVAASLASCVAETVMTGLLGGGHAIHWDAATRTAENVDGFCAVPSGTGAELVHLEVPFGAELVHYAIGPASCAVPGVPGLLGELHARHGRLPWSRLCEPALRLARTGVPMPPAHVACLVMLEPVMTLREGARLYAPNGHLLEPGELLQQPGLVRALEALAAEGAASAYTGTLADALLALSDERGGLLTHADLESYRAEWLAPLSVRWRGRDVLTRGGLAGIRDALERFDSPGSLALVDALDEAHAPETHTTNLVAVDADGNACVITTSLGLGSGDWLPGFDLHLNSMLGEADLLRGDLQPGARMHSMMAPTLVVAGDGLELAVGAAGGTRLRTALLTVLAGIVDDGLEAQAAVEVPRIHPAGDVVNAEPGADESTLAVLESRGRTVRRWLERHHYFGGVSGIGSAGLAADPRRSGAALRAAR
ncbi:MAG TPA: gamma-glutamyltransferase [Gaiellaceae bacterium]|jgi:gamma-glutamyltranspeptidase / glutathione hydrolase